MLFAAIEAVLTELKVSQILVPSIRSLKRMWCQNFYFERMTLDEVAKVEDHIVFPDQDSCILLRKTLGKQIAPLRVATGAAGSSKHKVPQGIALWQGKVVCGTIMRCHREVNMPCRRGTEKEAGRHAELQSKPARRWFVNMRVTAANLAKTRMAERMCTCLRLMRKEQRMVM